MCRTYQFAAEPESAATIASDGSRPEEYGKFDPTTSSVSQSIIISYDGLVPSSPSRPKKSPCTEP
jgi:hypothetical protein